MYLTSIALNPSRRETRKLVSSPQAMHAAVLCGFPPGASAGDGRVLWRLDQEAPHDLSLWVSSPTRPDYRGLVENTSWPESPVAWRTADTDPFLDQLDTGQAWRFRTTLNPTRSISRKDHGRGRVKAVPDDEQVDWLLSKAEQHGFAIGQNSLGLPNLSATKQRTVRFERRTGGKPRTVTVVTATFDGILEVRNAAALRHVLVAGMGRAKGYGCGLLTLAPLG